MATLYRRFCGGFVLIQAGVFCDSHHGKDFLEVGREAEGGDSLAVFVGLHQHLNDERDAAGVDVVDFGEVEQDRLGFTHGLEGTEQSIVRAGRDIATEAKHGNLTAVAIGDLIDTCSGFRLHLSPFPYLAG
jgi:hypothetical protein